MFIKFANFILKRSNVFDIKQEGNELIMTTDSIGDLKEVFADEFHAQVRLLELAEKLEVKK